MGLHLGFLVVFPLCNAFWVFLGFTVRGPRQFVLFFRFAVVGSFSRRTQASSLGFLVVFRSSTRFGSFWATTVQIFWFFFGLRTSPTLPGPPWRESVMEGEAVRAPTSGAPSIEGELGEKNPEPHKDVLWVVWAGVTSSPRAARGGCEKAPRGGVTHTHPSARKRCA